MNPPASSWRWLGRARIPARAAYALILLLATLSPYKYDPAPDRVEWRINRALHPYIGGMDVIDGARNVVLFGGWGVVWALTAAGATRRIMVEATLTGAIISAAVETAQLFSSNRNTSVLDLMTNTAGAFAGAVLLLVLVLLTRERRGERSFVGLPTALFAVSYCTATFLEAFIPLFRQSSLWNASGGPFHRLSQALAALHWSSIGHFTSSDLLLFIPAGALAVAALAEHGVSYPRAAGQTIVGGTLLVLLAELLHGGLGQPIEVGAVLIHLVAVGLGAFVTVRWLPRLSVALRGRARVHAFVVGYMAILAAWSWRPFLPEASLGSMASKFASNWYVPLAALNMRADFFSVVDVCNQFLLYLPLGALLAVWPWRTRGWLAGPLPAIWLACALEVGQVLLVGRMVDITDAMVMSSGALIGWAVVRRAGYPVYGELGIAAK